jgi:hypothetical protein
MIDQLLIDHKDLDSSQLAPCDQDSVKNYPFGYYQVDLAVLSLQELP